MALYGLRSGGDESARRSGIAWCAFARKVATMNVVFAVVLAALFAGSLLIHFWPSIEALSGGPAAFLGALVGAAAGLGAILAGALYNAKLNRDENKRLREQERIAVAVEVQADMAALLLQAVVAKQVMSRRRVSGRPITIGDFALLDLPQREFLRGAPGQLGVLGPDLCFEIGRAHMSLANIRNSFAGLRLLDSATPLTAGNAAEFETSFAGLATACQRAMEALEALTGGIIAWKSPELDLPEPEAAPE